jgi:hypothetical protein
MIGEEMSQQITTATKTVAPRMRRILFRGSGRGMAIIRARGEVFI